MKGERYAVRALRRGIDVLRLFHSGQRALSIAQISHLLRQPSASTLRIVRTLCDCGFLELMPSGVAYQPSVMVGRVGWQFIASLPLLAAAREPMQRLFAKTGQTVNLGIMVGHHIYYVHRVRANPILVGRSPLAERLPAYCTSAGKVILAHLSAAERQDYLNRTSLVRRGPNTILQRKKLANALAEVARAGYAIQDEEFGFGLRSIAAAVRRPSGEVAGALNIAVGSTGMTVAQMRRSLASDLMATARQTEQRLAIYQPTATRSRPLMVTSAEHKSRYHITSLAAGCSVISMLADHGPLRLSQIAGGTNLTVPSTFRILSTLEGCGLVEHSSHGPYSLTAQVIECGYSAFSALDLPELAHTALTALSSKVDGNIHVGIVTGPEIINLLSLRRTDLIPLHGNRYPIYCTATGKLWLSRQSPSRLRDIIPQLDMKRIGPRTITKSKPLLEDIASIRTRGYSISDEELFPGIYSLAAPICTPEDDWIAGLSVAMPKRLVRGENISKRVVPYLFEATRQISEKLKYVAWYDPISAQREDFSRAPSKIVYGGKKELSRHS